MPIYSNNRTGCNELDLIAANESYTCNDFGRILYESQLNDMTFFEAILTCDFKEAKGLQEGTILQSEVKAINEASFKEIKDKLVERLKAFWAKIQGVFKSAIDKFSAYALGDGKAFVREFNKAVENSIGDISKWTGSVEATFIYTYNDVFDFIELSELRKMLKQRNDIDPNEIVSKLLNGKSAKEFPKYAFETAKHIITINRAKINDCILSVQYGGNIDGLRNYEKSTKNKINEIIKKINDMNIDNAEASRMIKIVNAFETAVVVKTRTMIAAEKYNMRSVRKALTDALASMKADAKNESLYIDDIDLVFAD